MPEKTIDPKAELEALLFYYGEPIEFKKAARLLGLAEKECRELAEKLDEDLRQNQRGLTVLFRENEIQLAARPDLEKIGETILKDEVKEELTPATLETLAIAAYLGPVSRATIDYIRGVNSSNTLRNLLIRGLLTRKVSPEKMNAYVYEVSFDFLKHLGIEKANRLPEYEKYNKIMESLTAAENEITTPVTEKTAS